MSANKSSNLAGSVIHVNPTRFLLTLIPSELHAGSLVTSPIRVASRPTQSRVCLSGALLTLPRMFHELQPRNMSCNLTLARGKMLTTRSAVGRTIRSQEAPTSRGNGGDTRKIVQSSAALSWGRRRVSFFRLPTHSNVIPNESY